MHETEPLDDPEAAGGLYTEEKRILIGKKRVGDNAQWRPASVATLNEFGDLINEEDLSVKRHCASVDIHTKKPSSIYSADTLNKLYEKLGQQQAEKLTGGFMGILLQFVIFSFAAIESALYPIIMEWSLYDEGEGRKTQHYMTTSVYATYYILSAIVGYIISSLWYGRTGIRNCRKGSALAALLPLAMVLSVSEILANGIMVFVISSVRSVVSQVRLPIVAILGFMLFGRRQTMVQWCMIAGVSCSVLGFSIASAARSAGSMQNLPPDGYETLAKYGSLIVLGQATLTSMAYAMSELAMHKFSYPFPVQMAQARTVCAVLTTMAAAVLSTHYGSGALFAGWNKKTLGLILFLVIRDWAQTFILKILSSVWKALSSGVGVCIVYAFECTFLGRNVDFILLSFLCSAVTDVFGYSFSRVQ